MTNKLFFICPTDYLESQINRNFSGNHFFMTTLGNMADFNTNTIYQVISIIETYAIDEILFVIAEENCIIRDAVELQKYKSINRLNQCYTHFQKNIKQRMSEPYFYPFNFIISFHLNQKMEELMNVLKNNLTILPKIKGIIYSKNNNKFIPVYSKIALLNPISLN